MSGADHIFGKQGGNLSEQKLQAYLEGRLSAEEQREVELYLAEDGLESDALEGLQQMEEQERQQTVQQLNLQLNRYLKGGRRRKALYKDNKWTILAMFIVLLLIVLGYIVLRLSAS